MKWEDPRTIWAESLNLHKNFPNNSSMDTGQENENQLRPLPLFLRTNRWSPCQIRNTLPLPSSLTRRHQDCTHSGEIEGIRISRIHGDLGWCIVLKPCIRGDGEGGRSYVATKVKGWNRMATKVKGWNCSDLSFWWNQRYFPLTLFHFFFAWVSLSSSLFLFGLDCRECFNYRIDIPDAEPALQLRRTLMQKIAEKRFNCIVDLPTAELISHYWEFADLQNRIPCRRVKRIMVLGMRKIGWWRWNFCIIEL